MMRPGSSGCGAGISENRRRKQEAMKRINTAVSLISAGLFLTGTGAFAAPSAAVLVDGNLRGARWTTVFTNAVDLSVAWDWQTNATVATLDITGMNGAITTNLYKNATSNWLWQVFSSDVPAVEDVYDLTLTFKKDGGVVVGALTSRLAVVKGAFGGAAVNAVPDNPSWTRVKENAVIPYDALFSGTATNAVSAQLAIAKRGGAAQTNVLAGVAGYYGWKIRNSDWGYGLFDLALAFPGMTNEWTAALMRLPDGFMFSVR